MIDITGNRYGKLTVVSYSGKSKSGKPMWLCRCDCGNTTVKVGANLKRGDTRSCGCEHYKDRPIKSLTGVVFGRLLVETYAGNSSWGCRCVCGNRVNVKTYSLVSGRTKSCGCLQRESASKRATKHGGSADPLYHVLNSMHQRCENPNCYDFQWYGADGIVVCEEWSLKNYSVFKEWAISAGYRPGLTIDRIDPKGPYSPENCRWVTIQAQQSNKRNSRGRGNPV